MVTLWHSDTGVASLMTAGDGTIASLPSESDQIHKSEEPPPHPVWPSEPLNSLPAPGLGNRTGAGRQAGPTAQQDRTSTQPRGAVAKDSVPSGTPIGNKEKPSRLVTGASAAPPPEAPTGGALLKGRKGEKGPGKGRVRGQREKGVVGGVEGGVATADGVAGKEGGVQGNLTGSGSTAKR